MKKILQRIVATGADWLPDAMILAGAASISWGARMVYEPAGFVVAGVFALAGGLVLVWGGK